MAFDRAGVLFGCVNIYLFIGKQFGWFPRLCDAKKTRWRLTVYHSWTHCIVRTAIDHDGVSVFEV